MYNIQPYTLTRGLHCRAHLELLLVLELFGPDSMAEVVGVAPEGLVHVDNHSTVIVNSWTKALLIQNGKHPLNKTKVYTCT